MKTQKEQYAVSTLYDWFKQNQDYFIGAEMELEFKDAGRNSACVTLECDSHIMQLCAWNHASCLDIQIMDVATEESTLPHTGDCSSREEFEAQLNEFLNWHKNQFKNT